MKEYPWKPDIYLDLAFKEVRDTAKEKFEDWLAEYLQEHEKLPPVSNYLKRLEKFAKEVLDAIANDDCLVEEHLLINCQEEDGRYIVDITPISSIGDTFILIDGYDTADKC